MRAFRRHTERGAEYSPRARSSPGDPHVAPRRASWGFTEDAPLADALALVRALPPVREGFVNVKAASKFGLFARFERYWVELRGAILVLFHDDTSIPVVGDEGLSRHIAGVVCVLRCTISQTRLNKTPTVRIRKPGRAGVVYLRLGTDSEAELWELALKRAVGQRVVGVSDFEFLSPIGRGASGKVFLVRDRETGEKLALKVIDKQKVFETHNAFRHAIDERLALELVDGHPFFSRLRYAFQTRMAFYLAIDFYAGGDLYQYLRTNSGRLDEQKARIVSAEVLLALEHLHSLGFIYRDLKPENILLDEAGHVHLADFGLCKLLPTSNLTSTICGTHTYAAPEMLASREYGTSVDLWALGIFLYHILSGRTPYEASDLDEVIKNMNCRHVRFSLTSSPECVNIITKLLNWDPTTRLGCGRTGMQEIREDPFFSNINFSAIFRRQHNSNGLRQREGLTEPGEKPSSSHQNSSRRSTNAIGDCNCKKQLGTASEHGAVDKLRSPTRKRSDYNNSCGPLLTWSLIKSQYHYPVASDAQSPRSHGDQTKIFGRIASIWDGMLEATESNDLRNFDMVEWGKVSVDHDEDDESYGDPSLWPMSKTRSRFVDGHMVAGFSYCSRDKSFSLPPYL